MSLMTNPAGSSVYPRIAHSVSPCVVRSTSSNRSPYDARLYAPRLERKHDNSSTMHVCYRTRVATLSPSVGSETRASCRFCASRTGRYAYNLICVCVLGFNAPSSTKVLDLGCHDRPVQPDKKGGISAICAMSQPGTFATGGYDHLVHLWSLSDTYQPAATPLAIRHTSVVQSLLAVRDTSDKLLSGSADCSVSVFDLAAERVINLLKLSNSVYHVHPVMSAFCALLEVGGSLVICN